MVRHDTTAADGRVRLRPTRLPSRHQRSSRCSPQPSELVVVQSESWSSTPPWRCAAIATSTATRAPGSCCRQAVELPVHRGRRRARRRRGVGRRRARDRARRSSRRHAGLHAAEPVLPAGRARRRGLDPVRRPAARLHPGAGDLRPRERPPARSPYGSSNPLSTAADVNGTRFGVCRDFTHLAITFCRALNIPARYVFGYLPDIDVPDDGADGLRRLDGGVARRPLVDVRPAQQRRRKGRIVIGRGRDASDVAMVTTFGGPWLLSMTVHAEEARPPRLTPCRTSPRAACAPTRGRGPCASTPRGARRAPRARRGTSR